MKKLKVDDVVIASTVLGGIREYKVKRIEGNKAITDFRIFNTRIYPGGNMFEFGCRKTTSSYWVKEK